MEDGRDILLVGHEMLYFGNGMWRTIINPNQLRHFGISVRDDYTREKEEGFGITVGDMIHIPFEMEGVTIYFESRLPTEEEIISLPRIEITSSQTCVSFRVLVTYICTIKTECSLNLM